MLCPLCTGARGPDMSSPSERRLRVAVLDDWEGTASMLTGDASLPSAISLHSFSDHVRDPDSLAERLAPFEAILVMRERTELGHALLSRLPDLKLVVTSGSVNRAIDLDAAVALGITVCGAPGVGNGTSDLTWGLILSLARDLPNGDRMVRAGSWTSGGVGMCLEGRRLGVVGFGQIGSRVAAVGRAFGMDVVAWSPTLDTERAATVGAEAVGIEFLFGNADVVTVHVPLLPDTKGLIDARLLSLMKPEALLVNTARAEIIDRAALVEALEAGHLGGVAVDVFDREPAAPDDPLVRARGRTVLSPHRGYVVDVTMAAYRRNQAAALRAYLEGDPIYVLAGPDS